MRVFVAGGTGFVGSHVVEALVREGHEVRLLLRPGSVGKVTSITREKVEFIHGDAFDDGPLREGIRGCHGVINLIGIIRDFPSWGITFEKIHFEATRNIARAAERVGVNRFLQMSALGVDWDEKTEYFRTKWKADQYLIDHDFDYTIFRPSVIFGDGDGFVSTLEALIRRSPVLVVPGDGTYPLQPVSVSDVASLFSRALEEEGTGERIFNVTGPKVYSYREILTLLSSSMGKRRVFIHLPLNLIIPFVIFLERIRSFPLTYDQLYMLTRGSKGDNRRIRERFGIPLESFEDYLNARFGDPGEKEVS